MAQKPQSGRYAKQSTIAVPRELADQIRELAKQHRVSVYELTAAIIEAGLKHGTVDVEVRKVSIALAAMTGKRR